MNKKKQGICRSGRTRDHKIGGHKTVWIAGFLCGTTNMFYRLGIVKKRERVGIVSVEFSVLAYLSKDMNSRVG